MDKKLRNLDMYYGSRNYYRIPIFKSVVTDGVKYIMDNGYSWFVTDALSIIDTKLAKKHSFLIVELNVDRKNKTAVMEIKSDDGVNVRTLYRKNYSYTDAEVDKLKLYWVEGVLMLSSEY